MPKNTGNLKQFNNNGIYSILSDKIKTTLIISACLLGVKCRYDGADNAIPDIKELGKQFTLIPVCPEQLGGLPTPRHPAELQAKAEDVLENRGIICNNIGQDVTAEFLRGAKISLKIALDNKAKLAVLKESSPSCGSTFIYDGTFTQKKIRGMGVTTALYLQHSIRVLSEKNINEL